MIYENDKREEKQRIKILHSDLSQYMTSLRVEKFEADQDEIQSNTVQSNIP